MLTDSSLYSDCGGMNMAGIINNRGLKGRLKLAEPMSKHTSWRVGGPADRFYIPRDVEDLRNFLGRLEEDEPVTWVGLGSNLLVRDGGIRGTVIATKNVMDDLDSIGAGRIRAGAGITCARLARYAVKTGLTGAEFLIGIPGTLGGALAMNAGAFGSETWDIVERVVSINRKGALLSRVKSDFTIGYRAVAMPLGEWFIAAELALQPDRGNTADHTMRELLAKRGLTQPIGEASCGSVFRNPDQGHPAARLIESCGLKGKKIGNACVSEKHANFIINLGNATASDIETLIQYVQREVYEKHDINLTPEVHIVGEAA
jgi:UDP-N-acetylmuramate dehydrogenase